MTPEGPALVGIDFTCAPSRRKPITAAHGRRDGRHVVLERVDELPTLAGFEGLLRRPGPWLAGCDFPFGLPRVFVDALGLGDDARAVITALRRRCPSRAELRRCIDGFGAGRPAGHKLPHRVCDTALAGTRSTSPLQTRYVPVGYMYYEGLWRLVQAGVHLPGLHAGDPSRAALEAYPGALAHELIGRRSYKNADRADRRAARAELLHALVQGRSRLGLCLVLPAGLRQPLLDDAGGDRLDAVLCLVQAAWALGRPHHGLPPDVDPVEGWITTAGPLAL